MHYLASCDGEGSESLVRRFRIENGEQVERDEVYGSPSTPVLENPEYQTRWYFKFFLGKIFINQFPYFTVHQNYVGADADKTPFFLSVVLTDANSQGVQQYRAILWRKTIEFWDEKSHEMLIDLRPKIKCSEIGTCVEPEANLQCEKDFSLSFTLRECSSLAGTKIEFLIS
ncbi:hypothetical protein CEXT_728611 [Caerostris extrusa]|uniref:Uncharacterized protein n=1 Tax=Caerostris extrusa TaxID=172846 RepID=A0AAV4NP79_CAEEX|nr:hypothetical protein CEXT_728611 [Caerostris extrusa]